jgi:hypothetical protein
VRIFLYRHHKTVQFEASRFRGRHATACCLSASLQCKSCSNIFDVLLLALEYLASEERLCSSGESRWQMDEWGGTLVKWYWQEVAKYLDKILCQCQFFYLKYHIQRPVNVERLTAWTMARSAPFVRVLWYFLSLIVWPWRYANFWVGRSVIYEIYLSEAQLFFLRKISCYFSP